MTIPLTGAGSFFVKLGHIAEAMNYLQAIIGGATTTGVTASLVARNTTLQADYAAGTPEYAIIDGFTTQFANATGNGAFQTTITGLLPTLQTLAQNTLVDMANTDTPLRQDLPPLTAALTLLIQQMTAATASVQNSTVSAGAQTAIATPVGNPVFVLSVKNATGLFCEYAMPETLTFVFTADSIVGGATAKQEVYSVLGQTPQANELSYQWGTSVVGSGVTISGQTLTDAAQNNAGGNMLQNSEFVTFTTANQADNWTYVVGSAGTSLGNIGQALSGYVDSSSIEFFGDGSTLQSITQIFNTTPATGVGAGGTAATIAPNTQYCVNLWIETAAAGAPAAGVLQVDLIDGSSNIINDNQATANSFTKSLTAVVNSWININGVFRTPANLPTTVKLRLHLTTAITSGKNLLIDRLAMTPMTPCYPGGPSYAGFSALTNPIGSGPTPDKWTFAISQAFGGFQKVLEVFYGMRTLGLQVPSNASPTVSDSLIA